MTDETARESRSVRTVKRSISLDADIANAVDGIAGKGHFSGYVENAVRRQLQRDALAELLADMEAANGPADPEAVARAAAALRA